MSLQWIEENKPEASIWYLSFWGKNRTYSLLVRCLLIVKYQKASDQLLMTKGPGPIREVFYNAFKIPYPIICLQKEDFLYICQQHFNVCCTFFLKCHYKWINATPFNCSTWLICLRESLSKALRAPRCIKGWGVLNKNESV